MNKNKLLSIIALNGDTSYSLAAKMGISPQTFSEKLNMKRRKGFTQTEIAFIKKAYQLDAQEIDAIFFDD